MPRFVNGTLKNLKGSFPVLAHENRNQEGMQNYLLRFLKVPILKQTSIYKIQKWVALLKNGVV